MKNTKRILSLVLVLALILTPILMGISTATAISGPVGDVIFNYPYDNSTPPTALKDIDWDKVDHNLNDGIFRETSRHTRKSVQNYTTAMSRPTM